jgi:hypothetical protein
LEQWKIRLRFHGTIENITYLQQTRANLHAREHAQALIKILSEFQQIIDKTEDLGGQVLKIYNDWYFLIKQIEIVLMNIGLQSHEVGSA